MGEEYMTERTDPDRGESSDEEDARATARAEENEKRRALKALDVWLDLRKQRGDNVDQRTPGWYARRGRSVGGSQLGKLAGFSKWGGPWQTVEDLAKERGWNGGAFRGWMPATAWGTLLEPLSPLLLAELGAVCRETGALWGRIPGHSNSPDGVAWLELGRLGKLIRSVTDARGKWRPTDGLDENDPRRKGALRVLEYKSAYSRVLTGEPSAEHMAQLHGGLDAVPLAKDGLLLNTVARRCPLRQWKAAPGFVAESMKKGQTEAYPSQDAPPEALAAVVFHFGPRKGKGLRAPPPTWPRGPAGGEEGYPPAEAMRSPMCADLFAFVEDAKRESTEEEKYSASRLRLLWLRSLNGGNLYDLGTAPADVVGEVVWMAQNRMLWTEFVARFPDRAGTSQERMEALCDAGIDRSSAAAVLPIKIMVIEGHVTDRQKESTTEALRPRVWGALDCAGRLVRGESPAEVHELFKEYLSGEAEAPAPALSASARCLEAARNRPDAKKDASRA